MPRRLTEITFLYISGYFHEKICVHVCVIIGIVHACKMIFWGWKQGTLGIRTPTVPPLYAEAANVTKALSLYM